MFLELPRTDSWGLSLSPFTISYKKKEIALKKSFYNLFQKLWKQHILEDATQFLNDLKLYENIKLLLFPIFFLITSSVCLYFWLLTSQNAVLFKTK